MLRDKEEYNKQFEDAIQKMIKNGWDEKKARQTLNEQIKIQKSGISINNETSHVNQSDKKHDINEKLNLNFKTSSESNKTAQEVYDSNFQELVLESNETIILDVYADWYQQTHTFFLKYIFSIY